MRSTFEENDMDFATECPYYKYEKNRTVYCEAASIKPPDKIARLELHLQFCADRKNYKNCPFYKMLNGYYERIYK